MSASTDRSSPRPINWTVTAVVFFAGSVLLWADRTNFSVAAAACSGRSGGRRSCAYSVRNPVCRCPLRKRG